MPLVMLAFARANVRALARARVLLLRTVKTEGAQTEDYHRPKSEGVANKAGEVSTREMAFLTTSRCSS